VSTSLLKSPVNWASFGYVDLIQPVGWYIDEKLKRHDGDIIWNDMDPSRKKDSLYKMHFLYIPSSPSNVDSAYMILLASAKKGSQGTSYMYMSTRWPSLAHYEPLSLLSLLYIEWPRIDIWNTSRRTVESYKDLQKTHTSEMLNTGTVVVYIARTLLIYPEQPLSKWSLFNE
jgi:hypothetical protein